MKRPLHQRIANQIQRWPNTHLGIGVVSRNTVDATIELANQFDIDLMLVASRRQVDSDSLGAGYVEGWTAARMAEHVRRRDAKGRVLLCRDHGGPWQNSQEISRGMSLGQAMDSACASYLEDIEAGFAVIHLDPSVAPDGQPDLEDVLERLFTLYRFCWDAGQRLGRDIVFEVGAEEQESISQSLEKLNAILTRITDFCRRETLPPPSFIVVQTGTKVMETRNVGSLDSPYRIDNELPAEVYLPMAVKLLSRFGIFMKQHNADYLSDEVLRWHPWFGIHAANVAPEFGVAESRAFLHILESSRRKDLRDRFLELAYASRKWEKWMLPGTSADDRQKAVIAGHYVFSDPRFREIKAAAQRHLDGSGLDVDRYLVDRIKEKITRYITAFRLVNAP